MIIHSRQTHQIYLKNLKGHEDVSVKDALNKALRDGKITNAEFTNILQSALDGKAPNKINDQEFHDIIKIVRKYVFSNEVFRDEAYNFLIKNYKMDGPYVYDNVMHLEGAKKVGTKSCAALVQYYTRPGLTWTWRQGARVRGNPNIKAGTAVATFEDGFYPNRDTGNHAAFYLRQTAGSIIVMDQWGNDNDKPTISERPMRFKGKAADGSFNDPSNNGDALFVIMSRG